MTTTSTIGPKDTSEIKVVEFNFDPELAALETISGAACAVTVTDGVDASPSSLLSGAAIVSGRTVTQKITGGIAGVTYHLRCTATGNTGSVHVVAGNVKVLTI